MACGNVKDIFLVVNGLKRAKSCIVKNYSKCLNCLKAAILSGHFHNLTGLSLLIVYQDYLTEPTTALTKDYFTKNENVLIQVS